jgi:hypothetical protein
LTLSRTGVLQFLSVELPSGVTADQVSGAVPAGGNRVTFRENCYIPMSEKVENVGGAFFASSAPGEYILHAPGELPAGQDVGFTRFAFDAGFLNSRKITVEALPVAVLTVTDLTVVPNPDATYSLFETEVVFFRISGDSTATYRVRYSGAPPVPAATINSQRFTIPPLAANSQRFTIPPLAADTVHNLEITATYPETHPVFHGPGRLPTIKLTADQRTNVCEALSVQLKTITLPAVGPVRAGAKVDFPTPIAARGIVVTSSLPAGATVPARVVPGKGRPAVNTFYAPNAVTEDTDVVLELDFGTAPKRQDRRQLNLTVHVTK